MNKILIAIALAFALASCGPLPQSTIQVNSDGNTSLVVTESHKVQPYYERVAKKDEVTFVHTVDPFGHRMTIMEYATTVCVADTQYTQGKTIEWSCSKL